METERLQRKKGADWGPVGGRLETAERKETGVGIKNYADAGGDVF